MSFQHSSAGLRSSLSCSSLHREGWTKYRPILQATVCVQAGLAIPHLPLDLGAPSLASEAQNQGFSFSAPGIVWGRVQPQASVPRGLVLKREEEEEDIVYIALKWSRDTEKMRGDIPELSEKGVWKSREHLKELSFRVKYTCYHPKQARVSLTLSALDNPSLWTSVPTVVKWNNAVLKPVVTYLGIFWTTC